jgi:hypothetical protein
VSQAVFRPLQNYANLFRAGVRLRGICGGQRFTLQIISPITPAFVADQFTNYSQTFSGLSKTGFSSTQPKNFKVLLICIN